MPITIPMSKLGLAPVPEPEIIPSTFDYDALDNAVASKAKAAAKRIHARLDAAKKSIVEIGNDLLAMKESLPHGEFGNWIAAEFTMTDRTAQNYMNAAKLVEGKSETVSHLPPKVLYALAAPSTPDVVKEVVIAEAEAGNTPKAADVKTMIAKAKAIEAATPDMPPAKKAAAVTAAVAAKKKVQPAKIAPKAKTKVADEADEAAEQAFAFLQKNLSKAKFTDSADLYYDAYGWSPEGKFGELIAAHIEPIREAALKKGAV